MHVLNVRGYVMARECGVCRCCRRRPAESIHELRTCGAMGSRVKATNPHNSIAVCGRLVGAMPSCHTYLQAHQIAFEGDAEATLVFTAKTSNARLWMKGLP